MVLYILNVITTHLIEQQFFVSFFDYLLWLFLWVI